MRQDVYVARACMDGICEIPEGIRGGSYDSGGAQAFIAAGEELLCKVGVQ